MGLTTAQRTVKAKYVRYNARFRYIVYCIFSLKVTKNIARYKVFVKPRFHCIGLSRKDDSFTSKQVPEYINNNGIQFW